MWGYAWSDLIVCFRVGSKVKDVTFFWGMFCSSFKNSCLSDLHHKFQKKILCSVTLNVVHRLRATVAQWREHFPLTKKPGFEFRRRSQIWN